MLLLPASCFVTNVDMTEMCDEGWEEIHNPSVHRTACKALARFHCACTHNDQHVLVMPNLQSLLCPLSLVCSLSQSEFAEELAEALAVGCRDCVDL